MQLRVHINFNNDVLFINIFQQKTNLSMINWFKILYKKYELIIHFKGFYSWKISIAH